MSCAEYYCRNLSHCCNHAHYKSYNSCCGEKRKNTVRGKAHRLFWACAFFSVFIWLHNDCVSVSSTALGMGLFCVSAKWSIKWEEQTVSVSAALPQYNIRSLSPYLSFVLSPISVDPFSHLVNLLLSEVQAADVYRIFNKKKTLSWEIHLETYSSLRGSLL